VAEDWRRLHNEELHKLYTSPNIISLIKSRRIRACSTHGEMHTKFLSENLKERDNLGDISVDGRIILDLILGKYGWRVWTGCI